MQKPRTFKSIPGIRDSTGGILSAVGHPRYKKQIHKWAFITGRVVALAAALALIIYSASWASDGSWEVAGVVFTAAMIFFIPFVLFGKKIKAIKKVKKYSKRNTAIIGWRYSG